MKDPAKFTNPNPVGTGPYTKIEKFQSQSYELRKNPDYWQPDKQQITASRCSPSPATTAPTSPHQRRGGLDAVHPGHREVLRRQGQEAQPLLVPGHRRHDQLRSPNTTKAPFDDPAARKALSMAVDRDQITKVAMNGYAEPADCTGLAHTYDKWRDTSLAASCTWTKYDTDAAAKALDAAGYKESGGKRKLKDGKDFTLDISVGSASSDWISVANVIKQDLAKVGITATVKTPDWSAVRPRTTPAPSTPASWSDDGATPYEYCAA